MEFEFTDSGLSSLEALDQAISRRILNKLRDWTESGTPMSFSEPIKDQKGIFRFRVGDWRIIVKPDYSSNKIAILRIGHRSRVYKTN